MRSIQLFILILVATSCGHETALEEPLILNRPIEAGQVLQPKEESDTLFVEKEMGICFVDSHGLKQGRWEIFSCNGGINEIRHYRNDTLHGYWMKMHHGMKQDATYNMGHKEGFERYFYDYGKDENIMTLAYYENNETLFYAHPGADMGGLVPIKGMNPKVDSVYIEVPFVNGSLWYEGLYVHDEPKGIHRAYYPNGMLHGEVNYRTNMYIEYDSLGGEIRSDSLHNYDNKRRFGPYVKIKEESL